MTGMREKREAVLLTCEAVRLPSLVSRVSPAGSGSWEKYSSRSSAGAETSELIFSFVCNIMNPNRSNPDVLRDVHT